MKQPIVCKHSFVAGDPGIFWSIPHPTTLIIMAMANDRTFIHRIMEAMHEIAVSKPVSRGELILKDGDIEQNLYFVETGAIRVFILTEFEELTIRFGYKGSFINSLSSFITGKPSEFYIEAIRKSVLKIIPKEKLTTLINESAESLGEYIQLMESLVTQQIEREIDLLTVSPSERLKRVLKRSPDLFQEIPLKYIASYLRMTPETLSRIRSS